MIGPPISPPDIAVARMPLASSRRSGGTIAGSSPVAAGLKKPPAAPVRPASTASIQTSATPPISSAAIVPCVITRARSAATITARRDIRSATTPPISSVATSGTVRQASTIPTSVGEPPSSSTAKASAMPTIRSPIIDTACAPSSNRNSRRRSTPMRGQGICGLGLVDARLTRG
jgi:hypothetical protein